MEKAESGQVIGRIIQGVQFQDGERVEQLNGPDSNRKVA